MSIHNGLNNTQEIETNTINPVPESNSEERDSSLDSQLHTESLNQPTSPAGSRGAVPVRTPIRRASMIISESSAENGMPYRRPPRMQSHSMKSRKNNETETKKKKRKRRKRHSCIGRIIASIITFCLVVFVIYSAIAISAIKKLQFQETGTRHLEEHSLAQSDDKVRNILLVGTDSRNTMEKGYVDSIHILSISKHNKTFTLTSLLENCYVNIPTIGAGKLSDAYTYGRETMLIDTITNEFGIPIDEYICYGFSAYINLVNALGGIELNISDQTMEQINHVLQEEINMKLRQDDQADLLNATGKVLLNGKQLLAYSRIQAEDGFDKLNIQDYVMSRILEKLKSADFSSKSDIVKDAFPILWTNMSTLTLYGLTVTLPIQLIRYDFQTLQLPAKNTYHEFTAENGEKGVTVDYDANLQLFQSYMTNPAVDS